LASNILPVIVAGLAPIILLAVIVFGVAANLVAWEPPLLWATQFGTANPRATNSVTAMTASSAGLFVTGFVGQPSQSGLNVTPSGWFVARHDLSGQRLWYQMFGNFSSYLSNAIAVSQNTTYVAGQVRAVAFAQSYDMNGALLWKTQFSAGSGIAEIRTASVDSTGVYFAGNAYYASNQTMFVRKYDIRGNLLWTRQFGNSTRDSLEGVYSTSGGGVYAGGTTAGSLQGQTSFSTGGNAFLQKYDSSGTLLWIREFGTTYGAAVSSISGDATGVYVAGTTGGLLSGNMQTLGNGFVRKYDFSGNPLWTVQFAAPDYDVIGQVLVSAGASGIYIFLTGPARDWVEKYDAAGNTVWITQARTGSMVSGIVSTNGGVFLAGATSNPFPGESLASDEDAFLAEYGESSSLVFFGINPPISFFVLGATIAFPVGMVIWVLRRRKKRGPGPHRIPASLQNVDISLTRRL
jgi:hypothetical protein